MESTREAFIRFLQQADVLRFGDFVAKSGRRIPYFINAGSIRTGAQIAQLGGFYADAYLSRLGRQNCVLYGPAYKGIPLAVATACALAGRGLDVPFFFNRKEAKDHGEGGLLVGHIPQPGEQVVIIEDVITAGTAIRESMQILSALPGVRVAAAFVMVDRGEKGSTQRSALQEIQDTFGFPVYAVVDVYDLIEYLRRDPAQAENVRRILDYLAVNGAQK